MRRVFSLLPPRKEKSHLALGGGEKQKDCGCDRLKQKRGFLLSLSLSFPPYYTLLLCFPSVSFSFPQQTLSLPPFSLCFPRANGEREKSGGSNNSFLLKQVPPLPSCGITWEGRGGGDQPPKRGKERERESVRACGLLFSPPPLPLPPPPPPRKPKVSLLLLLLSIVTGSSFLRAERSPVLPWRKKRRRRR